MEGLTHADPLSVAAARHGRTFRCDQLVERINPKSTFLKRLDEISGIHPTHAEIFQHARSIKAAYIDSLGVGGASLRAVQREGV